MDNIRKGQPIICSQSFGPWKKNSGSCRYKQTSCSRTNVSDHAIAPTDSQLLLEVSTYSSRSIKRTSLEILGYMNDVTARRIGFHGSDEIGRTSVLKDLISNPKIKDLFDVVIWVTVARNWSTRKVQDIVTTVTIVIRRLQHWFWNCRETASSSKKPNLANGFCWFWMMFGSRLI